MEIITHSERETEDAGAAFAAGIPDGTVVAMYGELGAGKTAFVRGLARGLGADEDEVSSPTFALLQLYQGRLPLYHFDLYRLSGQEAEELGFEEFFFGQGVCAVEWPDCALELLRPAKPKTVRLTAGEGDLRTIALEGFDALPEPGRILALGLCGAP